MAERSEVKIGEHGEARLMWRMSKKKNPYTNIGRLTSNEATLAMSPSPKPYHKASRKNINKYEIRMISICPIYSAVG